MNKNIFFARYESLNFFCYGFRIIRNIFIVRIVFNFFIDFEASSFDFISYTFDHKVSSFWNMNLLQLKRYSTVLKLNLFSMKRKLRMCLSKMMPDTSKTIGIFDQFYEPQNHIQALSKLRYRVIPQYP